MNALRVFTSATCSTIGLTQTKVEVEDSRNKWSDATELLSKWGCNDDDLVRIFLRCPSLRNADPAQVQSKLCLLTDLGLCASELVRIVNCRPRFFRSQINRCLEERITHLTSLFETKEVLQKAIVRNPSLLLSEGRYNIKATVEIYEKLGVKKGDLVQMLLLRPMFISRTSFDAEKLEYLSKIGLTKDSKMYKYVVTLIGISRVETIRDKLANFARFGFSEDEIFGLVGRSPNVLTLSTDKVQRNMTFILGTMKLDPKVVLKQPYLLYANVDTVLKPRVLLVLKMQDMDSKLQMMGTTMVRSLRMPEQRFLRLFVKCHQEDVANELMEFYKRTKEVKRLGESSKKYSKRGFPF
ncbi:Mitochodrial transcription termination factor-related [Spatholobus suberectus]|nr:Mitochodrial transcription termination factor-related [Spatholobus suberectus]